MDETKGWTRKVISMGLLDEREYTAGLHSSFDASLTSFFIEKDKKWMWGVKKAGETAGAGGGFMDLRCDRDSERKQHC